MLRINNIFESISGEAGGFLQGTWTSFIRLQGCNLRCSYCDTPQAQNSGTVAASQAGAVHKEEGYTLTVESLLEVPLRQRVLITGGEPLLQPDTMQLLRELLDRGHSIQVETNGSRTIPPLPRIHWVIDRKTPSSWMERYMFPIGVFAEQLKMIRDAGAHAYIKWVITDDEDTGFMIQEIQSLISTGVIVPFIVSPVNACGLGIPSIVATIREQNHLLLDHVIFSVQLHKLFEMD